jgi:hypothetical protein
MRGDLFIKTHRLNNILVDHMLALFILKRQWAVGVEKKKKIHQWAFPEPSIQRL